MIYSTLSELQVKENLMKLVCCFQQCGVDDNAAL
jgi:hypothetical protein